MPYTKTFFLYRIGEFFYKFFIINIFVVKLFYNNLGIRAMIIYFYCILKAHKKTNNLAYIP